jgi:hypothetical protein
LFSILEDNPNLKKLLFIQQINKLAKHQPLMLENQEQADNEH